MVSLHMPRWPTVYSVNCLNYILCDMQIWTICSTRNLSQSCAEKLPRKSLEKPYSTALVLWGSIFGIYFETLWCQLVSYVYSCKTDPTLVISPHQKRGWKSKSAISAREERSAQLVCVQASACSHKELQLSAVKCKEMADKAIAVTQTPQWWNWDCP